MALVRKGVVPGTPGRLIKTPIRLGSGPGAGVPSVPGSGARKPVARKPVRRVVPR